MTEATTQLKIGASLDGSFEATTQTAKRKIGDIGTAARDAGKNTGAIGDGMAGSAAKVESATKNMINSIQRQTAALEAGDKASRQYQETLARSRGIDVAALRPYLDHLDQVKAKQLEAARSAEAFASGVNTVKVAALAAVASAGAMVVFAKSIIDVADNLNDMSQRIGVSVKELGKYQLAAEQSGSSLEAIAKGVKGLAGNMLEHGAALRKAGVDATTADGAMQQLAEIFKDMPDGIEKTTLATKLFGKAGMDLIPMLNLGSEGLHDAAIASADYAEQMAILAPLADSLNDKMAEIALSTKTAGAIMVGEFLPSLNKVAEAILGAEVGANSFAKAFGAGINNVLTAAVLLISDVTFVFKGMGREIGGIIAQFSAMGEAGGVLTSQGRAAWTAVGNAMKEDAEKARTELDKFQAYMVSKASETAAKVQSAYNSRQGFGDTQSTRGSLLLKSLGGDAEAKKAISGANKELEKQAKLLAELSGLTGSFAEDWDRLSTMYKSGKLSLEGLTKAQADLLAKQPAIKAAAEAQKKAHDEAAKAMSDAAKSSKAYFAEMAKGEADMAKANDKLREENELIGLTAEQKDRLILARMDNAIAIQAEANALLNLQNSSEEEIASAKRRLALAKDERNLTANGIVAREAKTAADEWKKAADKIESSLTDAFMDAINGTKSLWVALRDSVVSMFSNMVLRPIVQGVMAPIAGAVTSSVMGTANAGSSALGLAGNIGGAASLGSAFTGAFSAGAAIGAEAFGAGMTMMGEASGLSSFLAGAGQTLGAMGPAGWAALAAIAVLSFAGNDFISAEDSGRAQRTYTAAGVGGAVTNTTGTAAQIASATTSADAIAAGYYDSIDRLGARAISAAFEVGYNTGEQGAHPNTVIGFNGGGAVYSSGEVSRADQPAVQLAASRAILTALKASEMPKYLAGVFDDITPSTATQEQITASLNGATALADFHAELQNLPWEPLKDQTYGAYKELIKFSGGLDKLKTNLGTFYSNFYSQDEQNAFTRQSIVASVNSHGGNLTTQQLAGMSRDQWRTMVEQSMLDDSTAGRELTASLLENSGAFASTTTAAKTNAQVLQDAAEAARDLADAQRDARQAAMDAVMRAVDAEKKIVTTAYEAQAAAIQKSLDTVGASISKLQSLSDSLKSSLNSMKLAGSEGITRAAAQAAISAALATARAGGGLPVDGQLNNALQTVSQPSASLYGDYESYAKDFYRTANDISALSDLTTAKLTADEITQDLLQQQLANAKTEFDATIEYLGTQVDLAQQAVDAANGINTSVLSVAEAIRNLDNYIEPNPNKKPSGLVDGTNGDHPSRGNRTISGPDGGYDGRGGSVFNLTDQQTRETDRQQIRDLGWGSGDNADAIRQLHEMQTAEGFSNEYLSSLFGFTEEQIRAMFDSQGLPSFAVGANRIPQDMIAQLHEGEAVIPAAYNPANNGGAARNDDAMLAKFDAMISRLERIESATSDTASHTRSTDRTMTFVTQGGTSMQSTLAESVLTL